MPSDWIGFLSTKEKQPCGPARWRYLDDGRIELDGQGVLTRSWPSAVNDWTDLIHAKAKKHGIEPQYLAAVMAIESGGVPGRCLKCSPAHSEKGCDHNGECNHREGMGLMQITITTAKAMNDGKSLTEQQLRFDNDLNVDLAAKYLRLQLNLNRGDYVNAAVAYNAGSVRCGRGATFTEPKEGCPPDQFGVTQGCVRLAKPAPDLVCAPSKMVPGKFNCTVNYPTNAIKLNNSAITNFLGKGGGTPPKRLPVTPPVPAPSRLGADLAMVAGGLMLGYAAAELFGLMPGKKKLALW